MDLNKLNILVTRPEQQADNFINLITQSNGSAISFPTISLDASPLTPEKELQLRNLDQMNIAIFVSLNAVKFSLQMLKSIKLKFPENLLVAAVGPSTKLELEKNAINVDIIPDQNYSSEGLLSTPELDDIVNEKIIVFRGESGRELLSSKLNERDAEVHNFDCYERIIPKIDIKPIVKALKSEKVDAITATSGASVHNSFAMLGKDSDLLKTILWIVASQRIAQECEKLGVENIVVADNAGDKAMLQALTEIDEEDSYNVDNYSESTQLEDSI